MLNLVFTLFFVLILSFGGREDEWVPAVELSYEFKVTLQETVYEILCEDTPNLSIFSQVAQQRYMQAAVRRADVLIVCFSLIDSESLTQTLTLVKSFPTHKILVGCKSDLTTSAPEGSIVGHPQAQKAMRDMH